MMIGYLMAGFTSRKQALHDMVAGCLVVNRSAPEELIRQGVREAGMPVWAIVLVVLAVSVFPLGILAAIAIPAYQDMAMRGKVAMAVQAGREATTAIEAFYVRNNRLPGDLKEADMPAPDARHISSVSMDPRSGAITVVLADKALEGKSILFEPNREADGRITWTCGSGDIKQRYLPHACRK
jgi:Tfp pilus assembly major pilin PilA